MSVEELRESVQEIEVYEYQPQSLKQAVESLGLVWPDTYHRGIDDARNVASNIKEMLG